MTTALQTQIADMITALEAMDTEDQQYEALLDAIDALGVLKQSFVDEYGCSTEAEAPLFMYEGTYGEFKS